MNKISSTTLDTVLKFIIRTGKVVIGARKTLKMVKLGKVKYVIMASNTPEEIKQDMEYHARLSDVKIILFPGSNKDLGTTIGKPFNVAVIGIQDLGQVSPEVLDRFTK